MVDRDVHRDGRVQVDAQNFSDRAEFLCQLRIKADGVAKATAVVIQVGFLALVTATPKPPINAAIATDWH